MSVKQRLRPPVNNPRTDIRTSPRQTTGRPLSPQRRGVLRCRCHLVAACFRLSLQPTEAVSSAAITCVHDQCRHSLDPPPVSLLSLATEASQILCGAALQEFGRCSQRPSSRCWGWHTSSRPLRQVPAEPLCNTSSSPCYAADRSKTPFCLRIA